MKKFNVISLVLVLLLVIVLTLSACTGNNADMPILDYLDTEITLKFEGGNVEEAKAEAIKYIASVEKIFGLTKAESDINKFNVLGIGESVEVSVEFLEVLSQADKIAKITEFAFNPYKDSMPQDAFAISGKTVTKLADIQVDLNGIAKGYISDKVLEIAKTHDIKRALVNLGGDIALFGDDFKIGIANPKNGGYFEVLTLSDCSVATSGLYERGQHIWAYDGEFITDSELVSVTVVTNSCMYADALATAFFVNPDAEWQFNFEYELKIY